MDNQQRQLRWWQRFFKHMASTRFGVWVLLNVATYTDPPLLRLTKGRVSIGSLAGLRVALLTTTGAKSGLERTIPLLYVMDGENVVLVASYGGGPRNPAWYYNLKANPEAVILKQGGEATYIARETTGEERNRLWEIAVGVYKGFAKYQLRAEDRQIPVMVLEPLAISY